MTPDRRTILTAGLAAAVGSGRADGAETATPPASRSRQQAAPPPDGTLRRDHASRAAAAEDFGHIVHRMPDAVFQPGSARDVARMIRRAGEQRRRIAPRGQGHSVYGRAQVRDGIVIDMTHLRAIREIRGDRIAVGAGAKWSEVLAATLPRGLTPPVLTDYLELSVGGTLAVGGIGGTTSRHGMQSDNVLALEVVTGRGETISCSPSADAELFDAVRAGLGQVGVITQATVRLIPAPGKVRRYVLTYPDLAGLLADERMLAAEDRFDAVQGAILPARGGWTFRLDAARYFSGDGVPDDDALLAGLSDERSAASLSTLRYFDYLNRLAALEQRLRANSQWFHPHPWLTTFVGDAEVGSVVGEELERLTPAELGGFGQIVLSAFRRAAVTSPLVRLPGDDPVYAFNLVRMPETDAAGEARRLVEANRAIYERVLAAGGTLYPVSAFPMSRNDWRRHFGPAWAGLRSAKQRFDPGGTLTPGYEVFGAEDI